MAKPKAQTDPLSWLFPRLERRGEALAPHWLFYRRLSINFALGLALGSAQPLTIILTYNHAPAGRSGEALGLRIMANKLTQIAVPLAFGGFGAALGAAPVFLATGAFLLLAGVASLRVVTPQRQDQR